MCGIYEIVCLSTAGGGGVLWYLGFGIGGVNNFGIWGVKLFGIWGKYLGFGI